MLTVGLDHSTPEGFAAQHARELQPLITRSLAFVMVLILDSALKYTRRLVFLC